jgi:hypothetical protein
MINNTHEHMQRFHKPDGVCFHCRRLADQHYPVGPITVTISTPDEDEAPKEFCNWKCFGAWAAAAAGGKFVMEDQ